METYEQITLDQWVQWKEDIRQKLAETAGNFVHIGYRLKQIRDSGILDGAADIFEFAEREYGLGKSTVSRFIAINERYSEGGDSLELKEEFRAFSSSKLSEMLTLPDNEIQLITERTTIREIRELKEFNRQETGHGTGEGSGNAGQKTGQEQKTAPDRTPLEKCLIDFFRDKKGMLNSIMGYLEADPPGYREAMERMNPSGQASHKKGIVFLFLYDWATGVKYKLLTQPEPVSMTWSDLLQVVSRIYGGYEKEDIWQDLYGEREVQEKEDIIPPQPVQEAGQSVATSQRDGGPELPEGGTDRTGSMKGEIPGAMEEQPAAAVEGTEGAGQEEQLPGQMDVHDYPELIPEEGRRDSHGTDTGGTADGGHQDPVTAGGSGSGEEENYDVPEPHEIPGTAEDDGCAGDPERTDDRTAEDAAWEEVREAVGEIRGRTVPHWGLERGIGTDQVQKLYRRAVDLAAALEKIMMIRSRKNEQEYHA